MAEALADRVNRRIADWAAGKRSVVAAAFVAGLVAALGQPPLGWYPAMVVGFALGFALWRRTPTLAHAAWAGWGLGSGYFGLTLVWIVQPFLVDVQRDGWMAPFALVLMAGGMALFWAAAGWGARWLAPVRFGGLAWAVALAAAELVRGVAFTGFPWGGPADGWVDTPLMQLAALVGAPGLGLLTFALAAALWGVVTGPHRLPRGALTAATLAAALSFGLWRQSGPPPGPAHPLHLRLVQPNAAQHLKWDPDYTMGFVERALDLTALPPAEGAAPPDLVIWPETTIPALIEQAGPLLAEAAATAAPARLVTGILRRDGSRYFNSAVALDQTGAIVALYDKHHLVPFGEYIPFGDLMARFGIRGLAQANGYGYSPGPGARLIEPVPGAGEVLPLICYEAIFARDLRAAPGRADWVMQLTNDAWFGTFSGPQQHLAQARLRAVEFGLPLVRAANTGISAVIDARGRVVGSLKLNTDGHLDADLPGALPPTLYARLGDAPVTLFTLLAVSGLALVRRRYPH